MKTAAISIPKSNTSVSIIGSSGFVSSCPLRSVLYGSPVRSVLYGSPSESYIPLQHHPMPSSSCPENINQTQIMKRPPYYLSSDSEIEDDAFDGTFDPNDPIVAQIFENVAKKLFEESQN